MTLFEKYELFSPASFARIPLLSRWAFDAAFLIAKWQMRSATRQSLQKLSGHLLNDIGLQLDETKTESAKRFWQD